MGDRIKQVKEAIAEERKTLLDIEAACEKESRSRNAEEKETWTNAKAKIEELRGELVDLEELESMKVEAAKEEARKASLVAGNAGVKTKVESSEEREIGKLSEKLDFRDMIDFMQGKKNDGVAKELDSEARHEAHTGGANFGYSPNGFAVPGSVYRYEWLKAEKRTDVDQSTSAIQPTVVGRYVEAIRQNSIYPQVIPSSNILMGLTGDFKIPAVGSQSLAWATAENSAAGDAGSNYTKDTLAPVRLTGYVDISNRVILQNGQQAVSMIMNDLGREAGNKIDAALFSTANVTNAIPSIAATSGVNTFTEAATYAAPSSSVNGTVYDDYLEALQTLANADAAQGALAFVGHSKLMSDLLKSPQVLSVSPAVRMIDVGAPLKLDINGVPFYLGTSNTSNGTTSADFIGGNFNFQYLGFFGGLDMSIDPYSVKLNDQIRIVVHQNLDSSAIRGGAFVKSTTLLS